MYSKSEELFGGAINSSVFLTTTNIVTRTALKGTVHKAYQMADDVNAYGFK